MRTRWHVMAITIAAIMAISLVGPVFAQQDSITVTLGPGRDGSQTGKATLTAKGNQTEVVIDIQPGTAGVEQPAHIHEGKCPGVGPVKHPLSNVVNGKSTTTVNATLQSLETGAFAINVHKGPGGDAGVYVACGELPAMAATTTPSASGGAQTLPRTGDGTGDVIAISSLIGMALVAFGYKLRKNIA